MIWEVMNKVCKLFPLNIIGLNIDVHRIARKVWREYFPDVSAIIYLVDSADPKRFAESKAELAVRKFI